MLKVTERRVGNVLVLDLMGELSGFSVLRKVIQRSLDRGERRIILNLERISSFDLPGAGELIASYTVADNRGSELKLVNPPEGLLDRLREAVMSMPFEQFDDEAEALASFAGDVG
jgi:anti-anti-sigma factor